MHGVAHCDKVFRRIVMTVAILDSHLLMDPVVSQRDRLVTLIKYFLVLTEIGKISNEEHLRVWHHCNIAFVLFLQLVEPCLDIPVNEEVSYQE